MPDKKPSQGFLDRISDWDSNNIIIHSHPESSPPDRTPGKIGTPTQPRFNPNHGEDGKFTSGGGFAATKQGADDAFAAAKQNADTAYAKAKQNADAAFATSKDEVAWNAAIKAASDAHASATKAASDAWDTATSDQIQRPMHEHTASGIPTTFDVGDANYRPAGQQHIGRAAHELGWEPTYSGVDISKERVLTKYDDPDILSARAETRAAGESFSLPGRGQIQRDAVDKAYGDGTNNWAGVPIQRNKIADIVIGGPGAGKSSAVAEPLAKANGATLIDADLVKKYLPGYADGRGAGFVHEESSLLTYGPLARRAIDNGDNIVMPLVGAAQASLLRRVGEFRDAGYEVNLHYVDVEPEEQMRRVISRFKDPAQRRFVDPIIVLDAGDRPRATFEDLKSSTAFAHTTWYDNNTRTLKVHHVRATYQVETRSMAETHGSQDKPSDDDALVEHLKQKVPAKPKAPLPMTYTNEEDIFEAMMAWRKQQQK